MDNIITVDLNIYMKAKEIQWRLPDDFEALVTWGRIFHITINYLSLLGMTYSGSELAALFIKPSVYGSGTASSLPKGKSYNRKVQAHKLILEAVSSLMACLLKMALNIDKND